MKKILVGTNDCGQRLDKFLQKSFPKLPISLMYKSIRKKRIKLNDKRCKPDCFLNEGDQITLFLRDELLELKKRKFSFSAAARLDVVFEDGNILVVNKPPGLLSHEASPGCDDTLVQRVWNYLIAKGQYNPQTENSFAPALCNRLDRNTGGLVLAAKDAQTLRLLNKKLKSREIKKYYICWVYGNPQKSDGIITGYLKKTPENKVIVCDEPRKNYKPIKMKYRTTKRVEDITELQIELITGRTHQIRAGLAHVGCPIVGDFKYGQKNAGCKQEPRHQMLCAFKIVFEFCEDAEKLNYLNKKVIELEKPLE